MRNHNKEAIAMTPVLEPVFKIYTIESVLAYNSSLYIEKHQQPDFEIIWICEGTGIQKVNQCQYQLGANKIYCVYPGQDHQLIAMPGTKGFVISFTEDFLLYGGGERETGHTSYLLRDFLQAPELLLGYETAEDMHDIILLMLKEIQRYSLLRAEILSKYLNIFMLYFRRELRDIGLHSNGKVSWCLVDRFFSALETNFKDHRTVGHYAKTLFVTPNYLNHLIKSRTGFSARYHIQQRILLAAKAALKESSSMKEIAFQLGFDDLAHFSKFFKNVSGLNFREFKRRLADDRVLQTAVLG